MKLTYLSFPHIMVKLIFQKRLVEKTGLSILSVNIQSVNAKFDEFQYFINRMNVTNPLSAICLQECWPCSLLPAVP